MLNRLGLGRAGSLFVEKETLFRVTFVACSFQHSEAVGLESRLTLFDDYTQSAD